MDELESVELVTRPTQSTQFYLFNLFADYIAPRGGRIWLNDLLYLLELLGVGERAARSTLSRMKQRGWFVTYREGRESRYEMTEEGQTILEEGDRRIFAGPFATWDGRWRLVVYSLPEELRAERNELRKKLIWLGYGNLAPGTWVSAHDRQDEIRSVAHTLEVESHVMLFCDAAGADRSVVAQCWDLDALAAQYEAFEHRHRPGFQVLQEELASGEPPPAESCFRRRFWLTYEYQSFPRQDPHLPRELLPAGWAGYRARDLILSYRALLAQGMGDFIGSVIGYE